ncbi:MAG: outer membrane beta-barrel protein [Pseudomonadota bacterium]
MIATRITAYAGAIALLAATSVFAEDAPPKPVTPTFGAVLASSGLTLNGYVEASYSHLSGEGLFTSGVANRVFDTQPSGFAVQQAAISIGYQPKEGFGAFVNLTAGNDADLIASYDAMGKTSKFDVTQAYVQYAGSNYTVIVGKFVTLAGAEVIGSPSSANFSRSILFGYTIPFTHTGVRATFAAADTVNLILGVNNGWDALKDTNTAKTVEVGATFVPVKTFTVAASGYFGKERIGGLVGSGPEGERTLIDVVATWNATDALTFVLNYDYGKQADVTGGESTPVDATWNGLAGYANYTVSDSWKVSLRAEYLDDKDGYRTGVMQKWKEVTGTVAYLPTKAVELRFEVRADSSDVQSFVKSIAAAEVAKSQTSVAVQALYKF